MSTKPKSKSETITINGVAYVPAASVAVQKTGSEVLVRTNSAGVHVGVLKSRAGREVVLEQARRIWSWTGAFTLFGVATKGVDRSGSRISVAVPEITLTEVIEIIPVVDGVDLSSTEA